MCNTAEAASVLVAKDMPRPSKRSMTSSDMIAVLMNQGAMMLTLIDIVGIVRRNDRMIPRTPHLLTVAKGSEGQRCLGHVRLRPSNVIAYLAQYCGDPGWST